MRVLFWLILVTPLSVGCDGEGTSKAEALEKECLTFCDDVSSYLARCEFQGAFDPDEVVEVNEWCPGHCSDYGDSTAEHECEEVFERYVDCLNATNWAALACSDEAAETAVVPCWDIQEELDYCVSPFGGEEDTGPVDTGGWE